MLMKTKLSKDFYLALQQYIDCNYVEGKQEEYKRPLFGMRKARVMQISAPKSMSVAPSSYACNAYKEDTLCDETLRAEPDYSDFLEDNQSALKERMKHLADTFQQYLMYLIKSRGLSNAEVYKRALITKQLFSKIKLNPQYHPDKATAMRLCVGAKLNLDEAKDLLARAGYALSPCDKRDIIFSFFLEHEVYDMIEIDIALEEHGLPCFIE